MEKQNQVCLKVGIRTECTIVFCTLNSVKLINAYLPFLGFCRIYFEKDTILIINMTVLLLKWQNYINFKDERKCQKGHAY